MDKKDYCDLDASMALKGLGYNKSSDYTYCYHCRVSDEMLEKHPGLSDSGYMDLIDEYGGPYKREEVYHTYIEPIKTFSRNSLIDTDLGEICSCIHLYDAQEWLRNTHNLHISTKPYPCEDGLMWMYEIRQFTQYLVCIIKNKTGFREAEEALLNGIKETVKLLKEEKLSE